MTTKTKMSNLEAFQELSIQIAVLEAKVDKLLELAMKENIVNINGDLNISGNIALDEQFSENFK